MQHQLRAGGTTAMEIDHHNPFRTDKNAYENLFLATKHCNGHKLQNWPSEEQKQKGIRFLNPCIEDDYGHQIFEDPETFELWGCTPAARYHIRKLYLNAPHLIDERRTRFAARKLWNQSGIVSLEGLPGLDDRAAIGALSALKAEVDRMIPDITQAAKPPPPAATFGSCS
jgi:hypothetical protein